MKYIATVETIYVNYDFKYTYLVVDNSCIFSINCIIKSTIVYKIKGSPRSKVFVSSNACYIYVGAVVVVE